MRSVQVSGTVPWSWLHTGLLLAVVVFGSAFSLGQTAASGDSPAGLAPPTVAAVERTAGEGVLSSIPTSNAWQIMLDGGVLMFPIAACSLIVVALFFERLIALRRGRVIPRPFVSRFLEQVAAGDLERQQALDLCEENGSPVALVFAGAVHKWGRPGVEVEQALLDAGERVTNSLRRYLRVFNGIATVGPLLGLLGTVFGMIQSFNVIATSDAMGRQELLARGISQALLTTAAGLVVAIPALVIYLYFASRVDRLIIEIDAVGQDLVHLIAAEEIENRGQKARAGKGRRIGPHRESSSDETAEEAADTGVRKPAETARKPAEAPQRKPAEAPQRKAA